MFLLFVWVTMNTAGVTTLYVTSFPTGTPRRIHVDSTWLLRRYVEDQISANFHVISTYFFDLISMVEKSTFHSTYSFCCNFDGRKIHVVSTYFYRCNFAGQKFHVVSTYFFRCSFDDRKIHVVSTYFFPCNFAGRNMHVVFTYFFWRNFDGRKFDIVFGKF